MTANSDTRSSPDEQPVELADDMLRKPEHRTLSPSADAMEGAAGPHMTAESLDGQLGPDEISDPDEIIKNNEAKHHP